MFINSSIKPQISLASNKFNFWSFISMNKEKSDDIFVTSSENIKTLLDDAASWMRVHLSLD